MNAPSAGAATSGAPLLNQIYEPYASVHAHDMHQGRMLQLLSAFPLLECWLTAMAFPLNQILFSIVLYFYLLTDPAFV